MRVALRVAVVVVAIILVLLLRYGCALYADAEARARSQWNCPVSQWVPVRAPQMALYSDDMGLHWYEVNDE